MTDVPTLSRETKLHALNELVLVRTAIRRYDAQQRCTSVCASGAYKTEWKTDDIATLFEVLRYVLENGFTVLTLIPYAIWTARLDPCTLLPQIDTRGATFTVEKMVDGMIPVLISMTYESETF